MTGLLGTLVIWRESKPASCCVCCNRTFNSSEKEDFTILMGTKFSIMKMRGPWHHYGDAALLRMSARSAHCRLGGE